MAPSVESAAGGVGVGLQIFNRKNYTKDLRSNVNHGIIKPRKQMKGGLAMKYQGIVKNRLSGEVRRTRLYGTYKEAHNRAETLGNRVYGKNYNWEIDVILVSEGEEEC